MEKKGFVAMFVVWLIVLLVIITVVPKIGDVILNQKITKNIVLSQTVDVNKEQIFEIMADPKQYPNVLPSTFLEIKIINILGQEIFREALKQFSGIYKKVLDFEEYGTGIYQLQLKTDEGTINRKVLVE